MNFPRIALSMLLLAGIPAAGRCALESRNTGAKLAITTALHGKVRIGEGRFWSDEALKDAEVQSRITTRADVFHFIAGTELEMYSQPASPQEQSSTHVRRPHRVADLPVAERTTKGPYGLRDLVGVWKLLSIEDVRSDGKPGYDIDLGRDLTGYLIVDQSGIACLQGMKRDRPKWVEAPEKAEATDAEFLAYGRGFFGYCVTGVQVHGNTLAGTVQTSNDPNEVGQTWKRPFSLQGNRLLLTPAFDEGGVHIQRTATFSRLDSPEEKQGPGK